MLRCFQVANRAVSAIYRRELSRNRTRHSYLSSSPLTNRTPQRSLDFHNFEGRRGRRGRKRLSAGKVYNKAQLCKRRKGGGGQTSRSHQFSKKIFHICAKSFHLQRLDLTGRDRERERERKWRMVELYSLFDLSHCPYNIKIRFHYFVLGVTILYNMLWSIATPNAKN